MCIRWDDRPGAGHVTVHLLLGWWCIDLMVTKVLGFKKVQVWSLLCHWLAETSWQVMNNSGLICLCVECSEAAAGGHQMPGMRWALKNISINGSLPSLFPSPSLLSSVVYAFKCRWSLGTPGLLETSWLMKVLGRIEPDHFQLLLIFDGLTQCCNWFVSSPSPLMSSCAHS